MTMILGQEKPSLVSLEHHGIKGMKWGHRKKHSSTEEIVGARLRQHSRLNKFIDAKGSASDPGGTANSRAAAQKRADKLEREFDTSEDRITANRLTRGEKVLTGLGIVVSLGVAAPLVATERIASTTLIKRSVNKARAKA